MSSRDGRRDGRRDGPRARARASTSRALATIVIILAARSSVARGGGGGGGGNAFTATVREWSGTVSGGVVKTWDAATASTEDAMGRKFGTTLVDSFSGVNVAAAVSSAAHGVGAGSQYDAAVGWSENAANALASEAVDLAQDAGKLAEMIIAWFKGLDCKLDANFFKDVAGKLKMPGIGELPGIIKGLGSDMVGRFTGNTCNTLWNAMYGDAGNAREAADVLKMAVSALKDKCPAVAQGGDRPAFTFGVILEGEVAVGASAGAGLEVGFGVDLNGERFCFLAHCAWAGITLDTPNGGVAAGFQVTGYKSISSVPGTASFLELGIGLGNPPFPVDGAGGISYVYAGDKLSDIVGAGFSLAADFSGGGIMPVGVSVAKGVCDCPVCVTVDGRKCGDAEPALDTTKRAFTVLGGDRPGGDLHAVAEISENGCIAECIKRANCVGVSYNHLSRWCFLKGTNGLRHTVSSSTKFHPRVPVGFIVQADGDRKGGDMSEWHGVSIDECAQRCLAWSTCVGFSYRSHSHICKTKGKHGLHGGYELNDHQYYHRIPSPKSTFTNSGLNLDGKDRGGGDRATVHTTLAECKSKCNEDKGCIGVSYNLAPGSKGVPCYTKGTNHISMHPQHSVHQLIHRMPNGFRIKQYGDRGGGDLFDAHVSLTECAELCFARSDCIGFSFDSNAGRCVPKGHSANTHYNHGAYQFYERVEAPFWHFVAVHHHDRPGGDIAGWIHHTNPQACFAACQKDPKCFGITYDGNSCGLKGTHAHAYYAHSHQWSFAYKVPNGFAIRGAGDRSGGDIHVTFAGVDTCARMCKEDDRCVGFSHNSNVQHCVLKGLHGLHPHHKPSHHQYYTIHGRGNSRALDASQAALGDSRSWTAFASHPNAIAFAVACVFAAAVATTLRHVSRRERTSAPTYGSV